MRPVDVEILSTATSPHPPGSMPHLLGLPLAAALLAPSNSSAHVALAEASARTAPATVWNSVTSLMDGPERWLGEPVRVVAQFESEVEAWEPLLTRFHPSAFRCVRVWGDEQWLWIEDEYEAPAARFFVRRGSMVDAALTAARPHDRLALEVVVREVMGGHAWIEVTDAAWTAQQTPEGTVLHAIRALDMIEREGWALALSEFDRALEPNLPGHVRRELETLREVAERAHDAAAER